MLDFIQAIVARAWFLFLFLFLSYLKGPFACTPLIIRQMEPKTTVPWVTPTLNLISEKIMHCAVCWGWGTAWELTHPDPWPFYDGRKNIDVSMKLNTWNISSLSTLVSHHILILMENRLQRRLYWSGFLFASTVKVQPTSVAFKPLMLESKQEWRGFTYTLSSPTSPKNKNRNKQTIKLSFAPRKGFLCLSLDFVVLYICFLSFWLFYY